MMDLGSAGLHWYMHGSLDAWWKALTNVGPVRVLPMVPAQENQRMALTPAATRDQVTPLSEILNSSLVQDVGVPPGGIGLFICQAARIAGTFVRALPAAALGGLYDLVGADEFDLWPLDERELAFEAAWPLVRIAFSFRDRL
jgi:hypothetical protein